MPSLGPLTLHFRHDTPFPQETWAAWFAPDELRFGQPDNQIILPARLDYAEFLLLNSQRPVNQIARLSGFTNESSFARAFRKRKGVSPRDMRRSENER